MSKIIKISFVILSLFFLVFISLFELRKIDFFDAWDLFDFISKNNTWDSEASKNIFYKKWNEIEYNFFMQKDFIWTISINTNKLDKIMKDYDIYIDDEKITKEDLKNLKIDSSKIIKIKWIALNDKTTKDKDENIDDLLDIEIVKEDEIIEEILESTWTLNNIQLSSHNFNSNINNLLIISWNNLENIEYINIWWTWFKPKFDNKKIYIWIDKNTFSAWDYFLIFQLKNKQIISYDKKISFSYDPNFINISWITPNIIKNDIERYLVIQWNNLSKVIRVQLSNNLVLKETSFKIVNNNVMTIKIPTWLSPWVYYINFMWTEWIFELSNSKFTIIN